MKHFAFVLPAVALAALSGCVVASRKTETRDYNNTGFDMIHASNGIDVVLSQGPFAVRAEAPEGNLDKIIIEQTGSELKLSRKSEMLWSGGGDHYVITISAPGISGILASGGADVESSALQGEKLAVSASGGGDVKLRALKVTNLTAQASGGGSIDAEGSCINATVDASGGGDFDGEDLACENATAAAASGGDIDIGASVKAAGAASSGGDIRFIGSPTTVSKDESSGGDVRVEAR